MNQKYNDQIDMTLHRPRLYNEDRYSNKKGWAGSKMFGKYLLYYNCFLVHGRKLHVFSAGLENLSNIGFVVGFSSSCSILEGRIGPVFCIASSLWQTQT